MKIKLTTLLFGLLLAVGWTSSASAQSVPDRSFTKRLGLPEVSAPMGAPNRVTGVSSVVHDKAYYQQYTYSWTDGNGVVHNNVDPTEAAENPYQIYELLRFVYGNPNFPGPTYSAYTPTYQREDPVYYGAIAGGWDISAAGNSSDRDITITFASYSILFNSITISGNNLSEPLTWTYASNGLNLPSGWIASQATLNQEEAQYNGTSIGGSGSSGYITIPASLLNGSTQVTVSIQCRRYSSNSETNNCNITVSGAAQPTLNVTGLTYNPYTWDVTLPEEGDNTFVQGTVIPPTEDGYTVLLVALKNKADMTLEPMIAPSNATHFETKEQLITYFTNNIAYVRLLTDGLRIGDGLGTGTVFNADGRLNRFFFLGKGQARKKAPRILERIAAGGFNERSGYGYTWVPYEDWYCEQVPFEEMYEQFSPTGGELDDSSQTLDLFDKLREGNVYDVVHDCGSVMQAEHEFSLSGKNGTEYYPFSGLNFFVPDYRLLYWTGTQSVNWSSGAQTYDVDGRDMNAYEYANPNYTTPGESHGSAFVPEYINYSYMSVYYAQYNMTYAPKVGIYRITLDAEATQVGTSHNPSNLNYNVTLTWVSSLNQMSGSIVPQTYTMYVIDENGNRTKLEPIGVKFYDAYGVELSEDNQNPFHVTQAVYAVPQNEHSYTIEYQVDGVADRGPAFHATSNRASVIIPGWNDFVGLLLDHHESDFVIDQYDSRDNWYRNFLAMVNEDIVNGLTVSKVTGAGDDHVVMNEFGLYRFLYNDDDEPIMPGTKVATITFDKDNATSEEVPFTVAYENQEIEKYDLKYKEGNQTVTVANAYNRDKMGIPESGTVRVKGNGDIVIWPNNYYAYIKSIRVYQNATGNQTVPNATWTAPDDLPSSWYVSPGSKWESFTTSAGDQVGYMEGGGYIAIPDVLDADKYPNARVEIVAYGESGNVCRILVNDQKQDLTSTSTTYTFKSPSPNAAPQRASETQIVTENFEDENTFPSFGLGGITANNHNGAFGDWKLYDGTGANVWGSGVTWTNQYEPQAWMPFNGATVTQATAHSGNKYMESICPLTTADAAESNETNGTNYTGWDGPNDHWLISPELSGKEQTISFYERIFSAGTVDEPYIETYEVRYSTTDNNPSSFTQVAASFSSQMTDWTLREVELPAGAKYFAIHHTSNNQFGMMIDDVTYEISNEAPAAEGGLLRLHLVMADQLKANIPDDNSHPDAYGYVLKWEQPASEEDHKQSGTVRVNIQKTDCEVEGYYTLDQIDADKNIGSRDENGNIVHDQGLTMDVLTADVEFDLSESNDLLNYYYLQAEENSTPDFNEDYVSKLHRQEDFTYREMLETSPDFDHVFNAGEHHYFDDSEPIKTGYYGVGNRYMSYAPSVTTWGVVRRYYEYDGLDNTYGGPIWKTAVGQAKLNSVTAERQTNKNNSVNWTTAAGPASLYILDGIEAEGYLPQPALTKVEFEPYMFRIFVESKNGKLRPYKTVDAVEGSATQGEHLDALVPDNELTDAQKYGPQCVWSGYVKYNEETGAMITDDSANGASIKKTVKTDADGNETEIYYTYNKAKVDRPDGYDDNDNPLGPWNQDAFNAMFGALDAMTLDDKNLIIQDDLKFFVRFYYVVKGHSVGHIPLNRDAEADRPGNGSESAGQSGGSATAVNEITYVGEIVSQTYYNIQGMESDKPFDGVNIVVTRFSDGTTSVSKVVR